MGVSHHGDARRTLGNANAQRIDALRAHGSSFDVVLAELPLPARLNAVRNGEVDFALARGEFAAPGLTVKPAWTEPLLVIVSKDHDAADLPAVSLGDLADSVLRLPSPDHDLPLRDAITAALREAGVRPRIGRPAGPAPDTIVEVGTDPRSWMVLPADQAAEIASDRVRAIPLKPPVLITGSVIVPGGGDRLPHASACAGPAFRDALNG